MTLPDERMRAVNYTREFLYSLIDSAQTPRVPLAVRYQARCCLRHYPSAFEMDRVAVACPTVFKVE